MSMQLQRNNNGRGNKRHALASEINVTPLVDVMLVLLVIFMVTSPMLVAGVNVDLPETTADPVPNQKDPIVVTVNAKGKVFIQNAEVEERLLIKKLRALAEKKQTSRILVRGDRNIHYGKVMEVIGDINAAGFSKVSLVTDIAQDRRKP